MRVGYARVSTKDQSLDLQVDAENLAKCDEVFCEIASEHINVHGKYEFNFEAARQRTGLRELRQPGELNP